MKILIIHPEGNIHNNPNLIGIVDILTDAGFTVEVMSPRRPALYQGEIRPNVKFSVVDVPSWRPGAFIFSNLNQSEWNNLPDAVNSRVGECDFVFGIDDGIAEAALIAKVKKVPCGFISYEIFFADEAGSEYKQREINACKDVALAICQDKTRSLYLSAENRIPIERIHSIPVVGRRFRACGKSDFLHKKFRLDKGANIALYMGSLDTWVMTDYLLESALGWPSDWYLVLHNRYRDARVAKMLDDRYGHHSQILFSNEPFARQEDMESLIGSADVGISFYKATYSSIYTGKNIEHIGMASGKTNTYLQHGIPVVTNSSGLYGRLIEEAGVGVVVDTSKPFTPVCVTGKLEKMRENIPAFYNKYLDLDFLMKPILSQLRSFYV
jgi:glycosyltransferase involved in cell wall biosynthesis